MTNEIPMPRSKSVKRVSITRHGESCTIAYSRTPALYGSNTFQVPFAISAASEVETPATGNTQAAADDRQRANG
jgi:hypothetical protein